jgi:hypothetical protein
MTDDTNPVNPAPSLTVADLLCALAAVDDPTSTEVWIEFKGDHGEPLNYEVDWISLETRTYHDDEATTVSVHGRWDPRG